MALGVNSENRQMRVVAKELVVDGVELGGVAPAAAIADIAVTGTYATDDTPIETAINSMLAAMRAHGIIAT